MSKPYEWSARVVDWLVSMRWEGLDPRTSVLRAVKVLHVGAGRGEACVSRGVVSEDVPPIPGLSVQIGDSVLVHLGDDRWAVRDGRNDSVDS